MEKDEVYVPKTRSDLGIPKAPNHEIDWEEIFGDTPIFTLFMLIRQQLLAFPAYLRKSFCLSKVAATQILKCSMCPDQSTIPNGQITSIVGAQLFYLSISHYEF